jgi:hypothetical protein
MRAWTGSAEEKEAQMVALVTVNERERLVSTVIIALVELSSFTIEFPEHVQHEKRQYCLDRLSDCGAAVEQVTEREFRVLCSTPNQLAHVGWALFHTHFADLCRVTSTSGWAEAKASVYPKPHKA